MLQNDVETAAEVLKKKKFVLTFNLKQFPISNREGQKKKKRKKKKKKNKPKLKVGA